MIRTGSLAFTRTALLAALVGWAGIAQAQSLSQSSHTAGGWEAQGSAAPQNSNRRAESSASSWQPTRADEAPLADPRTQKRPAKKWIAPTKTAANTPAAAPKNNQARVNRPTAVQSRQTAARAPKPFVPPADAKQMAATPKPVKPAFNGSSAIQSEEPAVTPTNNQVAENSRPAPRSPQDRTSYRPRPDASPKAERPSMANRLFDDSWIRPLKQVAYQEGEVEELYAPPGHESRVPARGARMQSQGRTMMEEPMMGDGPMMGPGMPSDGEWIGSSGGGCCDGSCGPNCECGSGCGCGDGVGCCSDCSECEDEQLDLCTVGPKDNESCHTVRIRVPKFHELMIFGGVHGFKGPLDRERDSGNFGFQEGFNIGSKIPFMDVGYQIGYQATQSQLSGDSATGITDAFAQHFYTMGMFKRSRDGFQGGAVWDLLVDERESSVAFSQVRAEFGFVDCGCHEFGIAGSVHLNDNLLVTNIGQSTTAFQAVDQYLLYYRMHGPRGGEGRLYGGVTDDVDGIVGADFALPLTDNFALLPAFTYMIPNSNTVTDPARQEAWNVSISMVWHWRGHARSCHSSPYRPLFNVADNGYMIIDHRP